MLKWRNNPLPSVDPYRVGPLFLVIIFIILHLSLVSTFGEICSLCPDHEGFAGGPLPKTPVFMGVVLACTPVGIVKLRQSIRRRT